MAVFNEAKTSFGKGEIAFTTDTIKVAILDNTFVPNIDTQVYFSDISGEITGGGYTAGGYTLASKTATTDTTNNRAEFDAADVVITSFTNVFRYLVVYKSTGVSATSRLICYIDLGADVPVTGSTYTITWNADGIFQLT